MATLFLVGILVMILYHLFIALYNITFHPLARVPGSKLAAMTQLYPTMWCYLNGRSIYYKKVNEMHQKHGSIVRVAPNEISLRDPKDFETIYSTRSCYTKDPIFYRTMGVPHGMFTAFGNEDHRKLRAPWSSFFSRASVTALESTIQTKIDTLCRRVLEELQDTNVVPIQTLLHALMSDIVSEYTLPDCLGMMERGSQAEQHTSALFERAGLIWILMINPVVYWVARCLSAASLMIGSSSSELDRLHKLSVSAVANASRSTASRNPPRCGSVLEQLAKKNKNNGMVLGKAIEDDIFSFNVAGAFNLGTTASITLYYILTDKTVHRLLLAELRNASHAPLCYAVLEKLPYMTACIMEGLRMGYGPIGRLPRVVPKPGASFKDHWVPGGYVVGVWSYVQHHNQDIWGEDHDVFSPDRWLVADRSRQMRKYLMTFGNDRRHCIGKELALATMYTSLASLIVKFPNLSVHGDFNARDLDDHFASTIPRGANRLVLCRDLEDE